MLCTENILLMHLIFWPTASLAAYFIAKHNKLGLKDTFLVAVGLRRVSSTWLIKFLGAVAVLGPLGLIVWSPLICGS